MSTSPTPSDALSDATVLVTGGAGFIGSHLADALVEHADVRVLDTLTTGRRATVPERAEFVEGDVRDAEAVDRAMTDVDVVFHLAANVSVRRSVERPRESHAVNVGGTLNVLEAARRADARAVVTSSAAVYGDPERVPVREDDPLEPQSPYGLEKLAVDHYARLYHDLYGLATVALRPFNAYGPRQQAGDYSGVISIFVEQARSGEPITVEGDGEQTRDFIYVGDVVRAFLAAAVTDRTGEAYNLGTGEQITIRELAETVSAVVGSDSDIVHTDPRPGDIRDSCAAVAKAREGLGFEATVGLAGGLERLVACE